jgi:4-nitrophenyl phosphatase
MPDLAQIRALIIDLDGVLWRGDTPLPGLPEFFVLLRKRHLPFLLASNNATTSPETVQAKLRRMGVEVAISEVLTSSEATATYLLGRLTHGAHLYAIGEAPLRSALEHAGFSLQDRADAVEAVVVGLDRQVTWDQLTEATLAIRAGALFVGTNPDVTLPTERGLGPGVGAILAALQAATGAQPMIVGKPEPPMYTQALARLHASPGWTLALGDRVETDVLGGKRAGLLTGLVLTGVTRRQDLPRAAVQPDWVFEDLPELCRALEGNPID